MLPAKGARLPASSSTGSRNSATCKGNAAPQSPPLPSPSTNPRTMPAAARLASPRSPSPRPHIAHASKPPRPDAFGNSGDPILEPEFNYVVYMVMEARKAGLQDDLNDFEEGEARPIEIHEAWTKLGSPMSFQAFQTARKGKARATTPIPPTPSINPPSTSAIQPDAFTGALSSKFGLPKAAIEAFSSKAVARASNIPKGKAGSCKYKPLKGAAREEASLLIDQALTSLLQLSEKHGTDPTAATKLFQKKLDYFSGSVWDMWEMQHALKRATKGGDQNGNSDGEEEDGGGEEASPSDRTGGDDEAPVSDKEDGSQGMSIAPINSIYCYSHQLLISYIDASVNRGRQAKEDAAAYNKEKAAAIEAGPEAFKTWASGIAAKGYTAITSLRQQISNDQTRTKAAAAAANDLDAFVSHFSYLCTCRQIIIVESNCLPSGSKCMGPVWPCCCRVHHWSCKAYAYQL